MQRTWMAALLCLAYVGTLVLVRRLGLRHEWAQHVAALAYALSPRALALIGSVSAEWECSALLPWVLAPLVVGLRGGPPRRYALLSAVAVVAMSGVNAAAVVGVLVLPALVLAWNLGSRQGRVLAAWWVGGVALATAWWVGPLLLLARNAPPFLQYTETAAVTTSNASPDQVLRGVTHWVSYLPGSPGRSGPPVTR